MIQQLSLRLIQTTLWTWTQHGKTCGALETQLLEPLGKKFFIRISGQMRNVID